MIKLKLKLDVMEIDYKILQRRIRAMEAMAFEGTVGTKTVLNKKEKSALSFIEDALLEKTETIETQKNEIESLKRELKLLSEEKQRSDKEHIAENNMLRKENAILKKELEKASEDKTLYKDYVKTLEKEMLRLPGTKEINKKSELVKQFIDFNISVYESLDKVPLKRTGQFSYDERNRLINKLLTRQLDVFTEEIKQTCEYLETEYTKNELSKGVRMGGITINTLGDFINAY